MARVALGTGSHSRLISLRDRLLMVRNSTISCNTLVDNCVGDSLRKPLPALNKFLNKLKWWTDAKFKGKYTIVGNKMPHGSQTDSFSCGIYMLNCLENSLFKAAVCRENGKSSERANIFNRITEVHLSTFGLNCTDLDDYLQISVDTNNVSNSIAKEDHNFTYWCSRIHNGHRYSCSPQASVEYIAYNSPKTTDLDNISIYSNDLVNTTTASAHSDSARPHDGIGVLVSLTSDTPNTSANLLDDYSKIDNMAVDDPITTETTEKSKQDFSKAEEPQA